MDACLWLLQTGVNPDAIRWIMPRDAWMLPREFAQNQKSSSAKLSAIRPNSLKLYQQPKTLMICMTAEAAGCVVRFDETIRPTMFHAATISKPELEALRSIKQIIRMGRVSALKLIKFSMRVY